MRGGDDARGRGGAPKVGAGPTGRYAALDGGGVKPGFDGAAPGRGGGSGSFDAEAAATDGGAVEGALEALALGCGVAASMAAASSGGGASPASVCACAFLKPVGSPLEVGAGSVAPPTMTASSACVGVPTGMTRVIDGASLVRADAASARMSALVAAGEVRPPATVAPSSSTESLVDAIDTVEPKLGPGAPSFARAGVEVALWGALGLVVDCSAIEELRASNVPAPSVHRKAAAGRDVYNETSDNDARAAWARTRLKRLVPFRLPEALACQALCRASFGRGTRVRYA